MFVYLDHLHSKLKKLGWAETKNFDQELVKLATI